MDETHQIDSLKQSLARSLEQLKAARDYALGFHVDPTHRLARKDKAEVQAILRAIRRELAEANLFVRSKFPPPLG